MDFSDTFRAYVDRQGARVACAVEYQFPIAGRRRYSAAPILDCKQNVVSWGTLRRTVDERSSQIQLVEFEVSHANSDRELEAILEGEDVRGVPAVVRYVSPDLEEHDWPVRFSGRIERFEYALGVVTVVIRTDDAVLRNTVIPRTKIAGLSIEASTGQADTGLVNGDEILPIVYGIHSSRNLINPADENEKPGFLPGVRYVGERDGPGWFIFALGTLKREGMVIYPVGKASELQFGVHNGVQATHVRYDDAVTDEEARLDAAGYTQDMGGSFGSAVTYTTAAGVTILNPVDQLRHLLCHFIYEDWRVAKAPASVLSDYQFDSAPVHRRSWGLARDFANQIHLEGSIHLDTERRAQEVVNDWLRANPLFRVFWRSDGTLAMCAFPGEWPGLPDSTSRSICLDWDDVGRTFQTRADTSGIAKRVRVSYHPNAATGGNESESVVEDTHQLDDVMVALDMNFSTARSAIPSPDTIVLGFPYQTPYPGNLTGVIVLNLYPQASYCSFLPSGRHGPGVHLAAGAWTQDTSGLACHASVDDPSESLDVARYSSVVLHPTTRVSGRWLWSFGPAPGRVAPSIVRLRASVRVSSADGVGADQPFQLTGLLQMGGADYYGSTVAVSNYTYSRASAGAALEQYQFITLGEWATNPATGSAWTDAALSAGDFRAGIAAVGDGLPTSSGSMTTVDVGSCWLEVKGAPTYAANDGILAAASRTLRLFRSQVTTLSLTVPLKDADLEPGDWVYVSGQRFPAPGADPVTLAAWDRRPMLVRSVTEQPGNLTAQVEMLDLRYAQPSLWATFRTAGRDTQTLAGSPYFDRGAGYGWTAKASLHAVHREPDYRMKLTTGPRVTPWGLAVCGVAIDCGRWIGLNNTFSLGSGGSFDYWSKVTNGSAAIGDSYASETYLIDEVDYRRSVYVNNNGESPNDWAYLSQSVSLASSTFVHSMRFGFKVYTRGPLYDEASPHTLHVRIVKDGTSSWIPGTGWVSGVTWVPLTNVGNGTQGMGSLAEVGDHWEWWSDEVDVGVGPNTITYDVGYCTQPGAVFWILAAPIVEWNHVSLRALRHDFVPTKAVAVQQESDRLRIENPPSSPVWNPERGTALVTLCPMWNNSDLLINTPKTILLALHDDSTPASPSYDAIRYFRGASETDSVLQFERYVAGSLVASASYDLAIDELATYMAPIKVAVRWTGSDGGELGLPANTLSIFRDGVRGVDGAGAGAALVYGPSSPAIYPGQDYPFEAAAGTSQAGTYADGYIADLEVYPFCLRDDEIVRLQRGLTYPTPTLTEFTVDLGLSVSITPTAGTIIGRACAVGQAREAVLFPASRAMACGWAIVMTSPTVVAHRAIAVSSARSAVPHAASRAGAAGRSRSPGISIVVGARRAGAAASARVAATQLCARSGATGAARSAMPSGGSVSSSRTPALGFARPVVVTIT